MGKEWSGQADARTKKIAAQRAARGVYERLLAEAAPDGGHQIDRNWPQMNADEHDNTAAYPCSSAFIGGQSSFGRPRRYR